MTGKALHQSAKVRTNSTANSICKVQIEAVKFADLWAGYPKTSTPYKDPATGKVPDIYSNQCAIRVSVSLHEVGLTLKSFKGASVAVKGKKAAVRAQELADWLKLQPFCGLPPKPESISGPDWQSKVKDRTGIVFFKDYWARSGEQSVATGDHIDLWNKSTLTAPGTRASVTNFLRFSLGVGSMFALFSDLGKAKEILFWEIK
jgi:hypothetical protein